MNCEAGLLESLRMNPADRQPVLKVAVPVPLPQLFDYLPPADSATPEPGCRVLVRFGRRKLAGVVVATAAGSQVPPNRLQRVLEVLDGGNPAVSAELLDLFAFCAAYYHHPPGEILFNALPPALRKPIGRLPPPPEDPPSPAALLPSPGPELTGEQRVALDGILGAVEGFHCHLVDGITGSGKTEIYLRLLARVLASGRQALVLVPEIGLTPQLVRRFSERLGLEPVVSHSGIAAGGRLRAWAGALRGDARLLLGTRSALFLPLRDPGLIIMDESHDPSYKQQDGFRFSARDLAVKRAQGLEIPIVLGSATPALETLYNAESGRYHWHRLRTRATGAAEPGWKLVDLRSQPTRCGLSDPALEAMAAVLGRGEQVLVFLNRRGYAPVLLCHSCGWHGQCSRCDANMTWHRSDRQLVCHHCDQRHPVPEFCPECRADALQGAGEGTEQLENWLQKRFSDFPLYRVDRDRMRRKGELEEVAAKVRGGDPCVMVGTQMLAKGHHFPKVTLVVVVNLDQALYSADFRALERMGQTLVQVAGRAGRAEHPGIVMLQTHHPDHAMLTTLIRSGYGEFARQLLCERRLAGLPPYAHQAVLRADATNREKVLEFLNRAARVWPRNGGSLFGPFPAMMERRGGRYRWYVLVQNEARPALQGGLKTWLPLVRELPEARRVRWAMDVDPQEF